MSSSTLSALVHAMRYEAEGVISIEVRPAPGTVPFPAFEPGAHVDLHLPNGLVRSYSLLEPATGGRYLIGVLHDRNSRGGSRYVHQQLRVGMTLPVSVPRNNFALHESAAHSVLVAGGIGVTPMLCMLRRLAELGKPVDFIYCARSRKEAAFVDEISALANSAIRLSFHFNDECGGSPDLRKLLGEYAADTHLYCCGPGPMLDAFERTCDALGYANVHIERFTPLVDHGGEALNADCYSVELKRSGKTVTVPPGVSLLDALLAAGVSHDYSCKEGVCGACETKVLAGEVEHRDSILTKAERASNKSMMVCVSGCRKGPLVLDI